MEIRKVRKADLPEISELCEICFGIPMSENYYTWLNGNQNHFYSYVMLDNNKIIAHQAIIERKYLFKGQNFVVGLSSGTMILPEYQKSGDFYYILKESLNNFKGDMIIGFPNENSHGIMRKLFKFNCVPQNLYRLYLKTKLSYIDSFYYDPFLRIDTEWRINNHPLKKYERIHNEKCNVIFKEYSGNSIDIIYTNTINNDFVDILVEFSHKYDSINIISVQGELLEQIGFEKVEGYEFVYKAYNKAYENVTFPCQMIDSDVY
jgi:hypothetical protein